jgi:hypothetical protein
MNVTIKVRTRSKRKVHINLRQIQEHVHPGNWVEAFSNENGG